jgi:hypothetical protein
VTAGAFEDWTDDRPRESVWRQIPLSAAISVIVHVLIVLAILATVAPEAWHLADRMQQEMPAVEVVPATVLERVVAPVPDFQVRTDRPSNALPPPVRKPVDSDSDLIARPDSPTNIQGLSPVDINALEQFVRATEQAERENPGQGWTWTTCSLLPPDRRALEPACDGLLLKARPNGDNIAVSLETPDGEVMAAIKRYEKSQAAVAKPDPKRNEDKTRDRSYRDKSDDYFGERPLGD